MPSTSSARLAVSESDLSPPGPCVHSEELAADKLDKICDTIAAGRIAARVLAGQVRVLELSEPQVRLLWFLRSSQRTENGRSSLPDQTRLAAGLGLSAAQVSSVVDLLRKQGMVASRPFPGDRRRQIWQLTPTGHEWTRRIATHLAQLSQKPEAA